MKYLLAFLWVFVHAGAMAQYFFQGKVVDESGKAIPAVSINIGIEKTMLLANNAGEFSFQYPTKPFFIQLSHIGYVTQKIQVKDSLPARIILQIDPAILDEAFVQAFERNANNNNIAAPIGNIHQVQIIRLGTGNLLQSVNNIPGVKMDERSPGSYRLGIRGNLLRSTFGVRNVKVYWNGLPFTDASGSTNFNAVAPAVISSIEIIKGPSGSMYGAGTGGAVLLKSGAPSLTENNSISVAASAGSYGTFSGNAQVILSKKNTTTFSIAHQQANGYRNHSAMKRDVALFTGSFHLSNNRKLNSLVFISHLFYETPGGLTEAELTANPRQARPAAGIFQGAETQKASINLKTVYAAFSHEWQISRLIKNTTGIYVSYTDFANPTIRNYEDKYDRGTGARTIFIKTWKNFDGVFGAEIQKGFFSASVFDNYAGNKANLKYHDYIQSWQANIFTQATYLFKGNWQLLAGLSFNHFYLGYKRITSNPIAKEGSNFSPQWVPRISLMKILEPVRIYASVSKGYSTPGIDELHAGDDRFNKALKAEKSINYELGFKATLINNQLWLNMSGYYFRLKNTIVGRRDSSGGDFYLNAGSTRQKGMEATVNYQPLIKVNGWIKSILLNVNCNYIHARFAHYQQGITKYDGNKITGTTPYGLSANADFVFSNDIYFNCTYSYTGKIPLNDANTVFAPSYNLLIAKLGYKFTIANTDTDFFLAINQSMNNPYGLGNDLNAAAKRYFNPSAPWMLNAGLKMKIGLE